MTIAPTRTGSPVGQRSSHWRLIRDASAPPGAAARRRLDAVIVPAARRAEHLDHAARLTARRGTLLVVLASRACDPGEAAAVVAAVPGARALIVDVPAGHRSPFLDLASSDPRLRALTPGPGSDLSLKRNLGLLLARLSGWHKILFLDDDVRVRPGELDKVAAGLDRHPVAGMELPSFPDNSVVCHARREAGLTQDVFVTGAVLGVDLDARPLSVFPDVYNEDWFFFAHHAAAGGVASTGEAVQQAYDPFADPARARREEFGDLLAEGLYALYEDGGTTARALTRSYWAWFAGERRRLLDTLLRRFASEGTNQSWRVLHALEASAAQLAAIGAGDCVDFIAAWQQDRGTFARRAAALQPAVPMAAALDQLGLGSAWRLAEFGWADRIAPPGARPAARPAPSSGPSSGLPVPDQPTRPTGSRRRSSVRPTSCGIG